MSYIAVPQSSGFRENDNQNFSDTEEQSFKASVQETIRQSMQQSVDDLLIPSPCGVQEKPLRNLVADDDSGGDDRFSEASLELLDMIDNKVMLRLDGHEADITNDSVSLAGDSDVSIVLPQFLSQEDDNHSIQRHLGTVTSEG